MSETKATSGLTKTEFRLTKKKTEHLRLYKTLTLKAYFDQGYGFTSYFKVIIVAFGASTLNVRNTLWIALIYGLSCFLIGWLFYHFKLKETENEIANHFNPFVKEMRQKI